MTTRFCPRRVFVRCRFFPCNHASFDTAAHLCHNVFIIHAEMLYGKNSLPSNAIHTFDSISVQRFFTLKLGHSGQHSLLSAH